MRYITTAYKKFKTRNYDYMYWSIDLHATIITPTYNLNNKHSEFYPWAIEVLQSLTANNKMKLILWTSSHPQPIKKFINRVAPFAISFDYVNENPECQKSDLCDFSEKFYFDILLDDKAGFNPKKDWGRVKKTLEKIGEWT